MRETETERMFCLIVLIVSYYLVIAGWKHEDDEEQ